MSTSNFNAKDYMTIHCLNDKIGDSNDYRAVLEIKNINNCLADKQSAPILYAIEMKKMLEMCFINVSVEYND